MEEHREFGGVWMLGEFLVVGAVGSNMKEVGNVLGCKESVLGSDWEVGGVWESMKRYGG